MAKGGALTKTAPKIIVVPDLFLQVFIEFVQQSELRLLPVGQHLIHFYLIWIRGVISPSLINLNSAVLQIGGRSRPAEAVSGSPASNLVGSY